MCGIAGIYRFTVPHPEDRGLVESMAERMRHRGPDADGVYQHKNCTLGHRRLSIIDLDARSNQPFTDVSGRYTVIFNGQIYNFREIKAKLSAYPFRTTSDTEVIVAAYAQWQERCLDQMDGMFAFVIYDAEKQTLFLARDRMGVKPFYYYVDKNVFLFASEIRALLASGLIPKKINNTALRECLLYQAPLSQNSIIEGIRQLSPGHYGYVTGTELRVASYWRMGSHRSQEEEDDAQVVVKVRQLLYESVERRMISDVPLGAFLSGGIDSSAVVAIMSQIEPPVNTFSVVFDEKEYDESVYSDVVAKMYATRHHKLLLSPRQFLEELPNALSAMDSPSADGMNTYIVSKLTRQSGITVAMSGLGGDELFAGYPNFKAWKRLVKSGFFRLPSPFQRIIATTWSARKSASHRNRIRIITGSGGDISVAYPAFRQAMLHRTVRALMNPRVQGADGFDQFSIENGLPADHAISQYSIAELTYYTRNILLKDTDQFSMASSLEVREPFFDHHLVEYVLQLPDKFKLGKAPKPLLVSALKDLLPESIVYRKKKGFMFPWDSWIRNELKDTAEINISYLIDQKIFDPGVLRQMYTDFKSGSRDIGWANIWQFIALGSWMRNNLGDGPS